MRYLILVLFAAAVAILSSCGKHASIAATQGNPDGLGEDYFTNPTTLWNAVSRGRLSEVNRILSQKKEGPNQRGLEGETLLMVACGDGGGAGKDGYEIAKALLKAGADVNLVDNQNQTALTFACASGNLDMVGLLLSYGAKVSVKDGQGQALLDLARNNKKIYDAILSASGSN